MGRRSNKNDSKRASCGSEAPPRPSHARHIPPCRNPAHFGSSSHLDSSFLAFPSRLAGSEECRPVSRRLGRLWRGPARHQDTGPGGSPSHLDLVLRVVLDLMLDLIPAPRRHEHHHRQLTPRRPRASSSARPPRCLRRSLRLLLLVLVLRGGREHHQLSLPRARHDHHNHLGLPRDFPVRPCSACVVVGALTLP